MKNLRLTSVNLWFTLQISSGLMTIRKFRHKGLRKFFENDDKSGIQVAHALKIGLVLDLLDAAVKPSDMDFPGSDFHPLKGDLKGFYSVHINGNWVIIFKFENGDVTDVDLVDYH